MSHTSQAQLRRNTKKTKRTIFMFHRFSLVKLRYRVAATSTFYDRRRTSSMLLWDGRRMISPKLERDGFNMLTKPQIDLDLAKIGTMTVQEAAAAAARAVAEAEAAIAEAEEASKEAEAAEVDAEAAEAFAEAVLKTLKAKATPKIVR